jgi:hypothetical protein
VSLPVFDPERKIILPAATYLGYHWRGCGSKLKS